MRIKFDPKEAQIGLAIRFDEDNAQEDLNEAMAGDDQRMEVFELTKASLRTIRGIKYVLLPDQAGAIRIPCERSHDVELDSWIIHKKEEEASKIAMRLIGITRFVDDGHDQYGDLIVRFGIDNLKEYERIRNILSKESTGSVEQYDVDVAPYFTATEWVLWPNGLNGKMLNMTEWAVRDGALTKEYDEDEDG
jgi:hypothetical protein